MSKPTKSDHWLDLAQKIGAKIDKDLLPQQEPPQSDEQQETSAEVAVQPAPENRVKAQADLKLQEDVEFEEKLAGEGMDCSTEDSLQPLADETIAQAEPAPELPAAVGHWFNLASSLGIEVPPPQPKKVVPPPQPKKEVPPPAPKAEAKAVEADKPTASDKAAGGSVSRSVFKAVSNAFSKVVSRPEEPVAAAPKADEPVAAAQDASQAVDSQSATSPVEDPAERKPASTASDGPLSLFEDPDLRLDTPGVLDAVFDGDQAVIANALGGRRPSRHRRPAPIEAEVEEEKVDSTSDFALEVADFAAQAHEEAPDAQEIGDASDTNDLSETGESDGGSETEKSGGNSDLEPSDDQKRGRRRKRRRRRKPARNDRDEAGDADAAGADESVEDLAGSTEAAQKKDSPRDAASPSRRRQTAAREDEDVDEDVDDDGNESTEKATHKKIPTWEEAITVLVSANMETRAKNPGGGGGPRGRGRRGRR